MSFCRRSRDIAIIGALAALILPLAARADILFLDLNNATKEIEAARRAAAARGEKLIVLPDLPSEALKKLSDAEKKWMRASRALTRCFQDRGRQAGGCEDQGRAREEAERERVQVRRQYEFNARALPPVLEKLKAEGRKLTSMVISGHDGTGHFSGELGDILDKDLQRAFSAHPELVENLRGVYLWGCYTAKPGMLEFNWRTMFPKADLVVGYDQKAPAKNSPPGWEYLEGALKKEPQLIAEKDAKKLLQLFSSLPGARKVHASACVRENFIAAGKIVNTEDIFRGCAISAEARALEKKYDCYYRAEDPGCENPPAESAQSPSPVRQYYNFLQSTDHCLRMGEFAAENRARPSLDKVIRLVLFNQVKANFQAQYRQNLLETDEFLEKLGAPETLRFSGLDKMNRAEILRKIRELSVFLSDERVKQAQGSVDGEPLADTDKERAGQVDVLSKTLDVLADHLRELRPKCVPFAWVEPDSTQRSGCRAGADMGRKGLEQSYRQLAVWEMERQNYQAEDALSALRASHNFRELGRSVNPGEFIPVERQRVELELRQMTAQIESARLQQEATRKGLEDTEDPMTGGEERGRALQSMVYYENLVADLQGKVAGKEKLLAYLRHREGLVKQGVNVDPGDAGTDRRVFAEANLADALASKSAMEGQLARSREYFKVAKPVTPPEPGEIFFPNPVHPYFYPVALEKMVQAWDRLVRAREIQVERLRLLEEAAKKGELSAETQRDAAELENQARALDLKGQKLLEHLNDFNAIALLEEVQAAARARSNGLGPNQFIQAQLDQLREQVRGTE